MERLVPDESFFNFFSSINPEEPDEDANDKEELMPEQKLHMNLEIAQSLIQEIIPYSVENYLGIKSGDGDFDDDDDDDAPDD